MVIGTEGRGPEFLYVRMREKTASFLKRLLELQKVPTVRMRLRWAERDPQLFRTRPGTLSSPEAF